MNKSVNLGRSEAIAQVLSAHKRVKACKVTYLSLALLTFRKAWAFHRMHVPLKTGPSAV